MKRAMMFSCILLLLCSGLFRVEFVEKTTAQEAPNESRERNAVERPDEPGVPAKSPTLDADDAWKIVPPTMKVIVKNDAGEPIKDVELFLNIWGGNVEKTYRETLYTDENGTVTFDLTEIQDKDFECFRMWSTPKEKYVAQFMNLDRLSGKRSVIPSEYSTVVKPGLTLGGTVVDEDGKPIQGARSNRYFETRLGFGEETTDAEGKWSTDKANPDVDEYRFQIWHPDYIDLNVVVMRGTPEMERFKNQTEKFVLKKGINVAGTITDSDGKPIADAKVELGHRQRYRYQSGKEYYQETKTDADGKYAFPATPSGEKHLIVTASGKAPQARQLAIEKDLAPQNFQLLPGNTIRFKVVDSDGKPVAGASVTPYNWLGTEHYLMYNNSLKTDEQGTVQWNEAPAEIIGYSIGTREMQSEQEFYPLEPREEPHTVTLHAQPIFLGKVVDKETKKPISNFTVVPGVIWTGEVGDRIVWQPWARAATNGEYRVVITSHVHAVAIRIDAEGYLSAESEPFVGVRGEKVVDLELTAAPPISGIVLLPDGTPAVNAEVRIIDSSNGRTDIFSGELNERMERNQGDYLRTSAEGKFSFRPRKEGYVIVVAHENGGAVADKEEVVTGTIKLKPWARVEVTLMCGDKPRASQAVSLFAGGTSCGLWDKEKPIPLFQTPGASDENGKVVFEKVYPEIEALLRMSTQVTSSVDHFLNVMDLGSVRFTPLPGETSKIQVGGVGSPVTGKVVLAEEFQKKILWNYANITFSTVDPTVSKPDYKSLPIPPEIDRKNQTAMMQWYWKWVRETEAGKAFYQNECMYNMQCDEKTKLCPIVLGTSIDAPINADGTFRVEDVEPGTYKVSFRSFQPKPASEIPVGADRDRSISTRDTFENRWTEPIIVVPPISGKQSNTPFDAGGVRIEL